MSHYPDILSIRANDVYQLIQSDGSDEYVYQVKGTATRDLAIVLDISIEQVHDLIQELQIEGLFIKIKRFFAIVTYLLTCT
jgi:hypothetical protein